jgi:hypothetical protein
LDQAPLIWLESLDKNSIDQWDPLKAQFTSNFRAPWDARVIAWTWQW